LAGHAADKEEMRDGHKIVVRCLEGKTHLININVGRRIILKGILNKV
jgi:hypothetical protein